MTENNKIYLSDPCEELASISHIRELMATDLDHAESQLRALTNMLLMERHKLPEKVVLDSSDGTWVRAVQFDDLNSITMIFNNGKRKEVSQTDGIYSIGEHVYSFNSSVYGIQDVNLLSHYKVSNLIRSEGVAAVTNSEWLEIFYRHLPNFRKNCPDDGYNIYDTNTFCTRTEHFRTYLMIGLTKILKSIPSFEGTVLVACADFTITSRRLMDDIIVEVNTYRQKCKFEPIKLVDVRSDSPLEYNSEVYVYYLFDVFVHPSMFAHQICMGSDSSPEIDGAFSKNLEGYEQLMTTNSSIILSSYKPIMDIMHTSNGKMYRQDLKSYSYAQHSYVPHKPWTLLNVGCSDNTMSLILPDRSDSAPTSRLKHRLALNLQMLHVNLNRNRMLANESAQKKLVKDFNGLADMIVNILVRLGYSGSPRNWELYSMMRHPVSKKKTMIKLSSDPKSSIDLIIVMSRLVADKLYRYQDLTMEGMTHSTISRAMELNLLTTIKSGSSYWYKKYERTSAVIHNYFSGPSFDMASPVTLVYGNGLVSSNSPGKPDEKVYKVSSELDDLQFNLNYTVPVSYGPEDYPTKGIGKIHKNKVMDQHNEYYSDTGTMKEYLQSRKRQIQAQKIKQSLNDSSSQDSSHSVQTSLATTSSEVDYVGGITMVEEGDLSQGYYESVSGQTGDICGLYDVFPDGSIIHYDADGSVSDFTPPLCNPFDEVTQEYVSLHDDSLIYGDPGWFIEDWGH